ncbi:3-isopropylmalate dehydratase large subunit [Candidatus Formimonas warabiya]|uniref:3-isopropylmalate dehydratase large subunit n=1 Tax=Formimonas warabiya TaxID=1761012 RepID=UPI0011D089E5|nr:3-isopropylmalate dehydratase large subunit [Candidatus Formimonas warabiya]
MGKTIAEKILSNKSGKDGFANDFVVADIDFMLSQDGNRPQALDVFYEMGGTKVFDPAKIIPVNDHAPSSPTESTAEIHRKIRKFAEEQNLKYYDIGAGICHQLIPQEGHVAPGDLVIGTDSHTVTYGAINVFSTGVGSSDLAAAMICGKLWFCIPETIKFVLKGKLSPGVYSKDLILYLIGMVGAGGAIYKAVEFTGEAIHDLSVDARFTISNMAVEMGAKAGLMEVDEKTEEWLKGRTRKEWHPVKADADAVYAKIIEVDVTKIAPQIAKPHTVDNTCSIEEIGDIPIHEAILGTCTNARLEDLRIAAGLLKGKKVHPKVRLFVSAASKRIFQEALKEGLLEIFSDAGAIIGIPGCSGCTGGSYFACASNGENIITTANRNFKGRISNPQANIYLASPATVIASALKGRIADCRNYLK